MLMDRRVEIFRCWRVRRKICWCRTSGVVRRSSSERVCEMGVVVLWRRMGGCERDRRGLGICRGGCLGSGERRALGVRRGRGGYVGMKGMLWRDGVCLTDGVLVSLSPDCVYTRIHTTPS